VIVFARSHSASKDARLSTGYGDAAIQEIVGLMRRLLDRFGRARDDGGDSV